jgi:hypothetical protein
MTENDWGCVAFSGSLFLFMVCVATDFTLFALVSASRRTGTKSYEVRWAFKKKKNNFLFSFFASRFVVDRR